MHRHSLFGMVIAAAAATAHAVPTVPSLPSGDPPDSAAWSEAKAGERVTGGVLKATAPGEDALQSAARHFGKTGKAWPIVGDDGSLLYPYGAYPPILTAAPLRATAIELEPGERVLNTALGDGARWLVDVAHGPVEHVIVKVKDAGLATNLLVMTDRRTYSLALRSRETDHMPRVAFYYPQAMVKTWAERRAQDLEAERQVIAKLPSLTAENLNFNYWVEGEEGMRPVRVFDDGTHVYLQMPPAMKAKDIPALFVLGPDGNEALVNYRVAAPYYVVDKLFEEARLVLGVGGEAVRVTIHKGEKPWYKALFD